MGFRADARKIQKIIGFEYRRQVFNWRFWLGLLGFPVMLAVIAGVLMVMTAFAIDRSPVGVVGPPDLNLTPPAGERDINTFRLFSSEGEAHIALLNKHIQAYFVLSPDADTTQLVYLKKPHSSVSMELRALLRRNLLADMDPERAERLTFGARVILQTANLEVPSQVSAFIKMGAAFGAIYIMLMIISAASGYMTNTISDERSNRILEVLLTSASHNHIMTGKVLGQLAITLTQVAVWGVAPVLGLILANRLQVPLLNELFTGPQVLVFVLGGILTLTLVSVLLSILGVTVMDTAEGQIASYFFNFCTVLPILMYQSITAAPSGPVALILTFFPFTSTAALLVRMSFSSVPAWQVLLSLLLLAAATRAAFWLAGRLFWLSLQERARSKPRFARLINLFQRVGKLRHA